MVKLALTRALALSALLAAPGALSAATIDFTASATGTSGSVNGVNWTLTSNIGTPNNSQRFDGQDSLPTISASGLAFQRDGYGVRSYLDQTANDDEITSMRRGSEALILTFARPVKLVGFAFLDLFLPVNGGPGEVGYAELSDGTILSIAATDLANVGTKRAGFASSAFKGLVTSSIKFYTGLTNDQQGLADGALASADIAPVPVPAAGVLMVAGLGGLAALRRRKR